MFQVWKAVWTVGGPRARRGLSEALVKLRIKPCCSDLHSALSVAVRGQRGGLRCWVTFISLGSHATYFHLVALLWEAQTSHQGADQAIQASLLISFSVTHVRCLSAYV